MQNSEIKPTKHVDGPLMYCSYFTNGIQGAKMRNKLMGETRVHDDIIQKLFDAESKCTNFDY